MLPPCTIRLSENEESGVIYWRAIVSTEDRETHTQLRFSDSRVTWWFCGR